LSLKLTKVLNTTKIALILYNIKQIKDLIKEADLKNIYEVIKS